MVSTNVSLGIEPLVAPHYNRRACGCNVGKSARSSAKIDD